MGAIDLVRSLIAEGVEFRTDGKRIRWHSLEGRMTPERVAVLAAAKLEIIDFLLGSIEPHQAIQDDALEQYEERAAIREFDGGQTRSDAETSAVADVATAHGLTPSRLKHRWYAHPDAQRYLSLVTNSGCLPLKAAAHVLGWTLERTWAADARLRACGVLRDGRLVADRLPPPVRWPRKERP